MKTRILTIASSLAALNVLADTPIQLSLTPDIALFPRDTTVNGLTLNIWGQNPQGALALGFVNGSTGNSAGLSIGLINYAQSYSGVQWGAINISTENFIGWQHGWINVAQGTFSGFQLAFVNVAEDATGFQLGAVNYAQNLRGLQIGVINIAMNNAMFDRFPDQLATGFPILNWSF